MWVNRVSPATLTSRVDCEFYEPNVYLHLAKLAEWKPRELKHFVTDMRSEPPIHTDHYADEGIHIVSPTNFTDFFLDLSATKKLGVQFRQNFTDFFLESGRILFALVGDVGHACVVPNPAPEAISYRRTASLKLARIDPYFVCSFLNTPAGVSQLSRMSTGVIQAQVRLEDSSTVLIPSVESDVQKYIGNKVRHAERLRAHSSQLDVRKHALIKMREMSEAFEVPDRISNRIECRALSADRCDPKYYSNKSIAIINAINDGGAQSIADLCLSMTNGFESRDFKAKGTPYLTVSEISSGRINVGSAPRIASNIEVPPKAKATCNCVLVVRGGSVGIAAKVFKWDEGAAISSDLIRLEFASESIAAAVGAFLGSPYGAYLMKRASYGAVMPKLGQHELASIMIPNSIIEIGKSLNELMILTEKCFRLSCALVDAAKSLVEAIIERKITEDEIIHAQTQLERGDDFADRAILRRLFEGGWDATDTLPLFPDLDAYYETLRMVEEEQTEVTAR